MKHEFTAFWLKPEAERQGISDSLLLSSGTEIFSAILDKKWHVFLRVCGEVRIRWKNIIYNDVSKFPDELKEFIRNRNVFLDPLTPKDSAPLNKNWYEFSVYDDENNCVNSNVIDVDIRELTEEDAKNFIIEELDDVIKLNLCDKWEEKEYPGPEDMKVQLKDHFGQEARFADSEIDEGVTETDSPDDYVMKDVFEMEDGTDIRIFYGNNSRLIGYIEIQEP